MNRFSFIIVIGVCALLLGANNCARAEPPPGFTRRWDPYFPPAPPLPEVSPETGLPLKWSTVGPEPFFGNPYIWGGGFGWGGFGWGGFGWNGFGGWGRFGGWGYYGGALGAYAPFGAGPFWRNTGFGDPRYGANFAGPYHGFYGPAQRVPGYRTYGPYNPPADAVVVPGMPQAPPQAEPVIAPNELPVPAIPQGP